MVIITSIIGVISFYVHSVIANIVGLLDFPAEIKIWKYSEFIIYTFYKTSFLFKRIFTDVLSQRIDKLNEDI